MPEAAAEHGLADPLALFCSAFYHLVSVEEAAGMAARLAWSAHSLAQPNEPHGKRSRPE